MKNTAKVSIIVPIYNVEKYVSKCLDSLINQTFKDIEIWAISDGSPDNSVKIIKNYQKKDNRIKCIEKENGGYGSVLEYAIKNIKTKYFLICDPDDWLKKDAIEKLYNSAENNNLDIVVASKYFVYNDNDEEKYCDCRIGNVKIEENIVYKETNIDKFAYVSVTPHAKLYRTEVSKKLKFPHKVNFTDFLLYIVSLNNSKRVMCLEEGLAYYLIDRPGNSVTDVNPKIFNYYIIVYKSVMEQLEEEKIKNLIIARMYTQFRHIILELKKRGSNDTILEYAPKIKDLLNLLEPYKFRIALFLPYKLKDKIFAFLLINKRTRDKYYKKILENKKIID